MTTRVVLAALLALVAVNAFGGGVYGMLGAEAVPKAWLEGSPFHSYFVPSLVLLVAVGGSAALATALVFRRAPTGPAAATAAGSILLLWIVVQIAIIGRVSWLQPAMALVAVFILALGAMLGPRTRSDARPPG